MSSTAPCHVFAYGSNLFTDRMVRRVPSAQVVGSATLPGHRLAFHMRSTDGSGKADATPSAAGEHRVEGVIYRLHPVHLEGLDRVEGGYLRRVHRFRLAGGGMVPKMGGVEGYGEVGTGTVGVIRAWTYHARPERIEPGMRPFRWYHELVVKGARSHGLSPAYVAGLEGVPVLPA
jgi:gamma-glutamylcyclotransferase